MAEEAKGAVETGATGATGTEETKGTQATETKAQENQAQTQQAMTADEINRLIQSGIDKHTSELGKKIAALQKENETVKKENETLKTEKMSADELKEFELSKREEALNERDKQITEQANRIYAIKAANAAGLDLGKDLEHLELIMGDNEEIINTKVKAVKAMIDNIVAEKVSQTFKTNGREPNGSKSTTEVKGSIAERLGKTRAEQQKKSNDVLSHYLGGN